MESEPKTNPITAMINRKREELAAASNQNSADGAIIKGPSLTALREAIGIKNPGSNESVELAPPLKRIYESSARIQEFQLYVSTFHPKADVVYYPGSASDISPTTAFPGSRVIYADVEEEDIDALQSAGKEAYRVSATEFDPRNVEGNPAPEINVVIMLNQYFQVNHVLEILAPGGYVLCNNYHSTAIDVSNYGGFKLVGVIDSTRQTEINQENLNEYFEPVETDEELMNARSGFARVSYKTAAAAVLKFTGKSENVLAEYKNLLLQNADRIHGDMIMMNDEERTILETTLPTKKGSTDSLFIFQKNAE